jgi:FkbM family methyltransferase
MEELSVEYVERLTDSVLSIVKSQSGLNPSEVARCADAFFAHRLLLGRNPGARDELPRVMRETATLREFLNGLLGSAEFGYTGGFLPPDRVLMAETEGFRFWFNTSDREMGVLMAFGRYEPRSVALFRSLLRPGMRCLDVGAQSGFYTCLMASRVGPAGAVHAFEPMPANCRMVARNVAENRFEDRVGLHPLAASDRESVIEGSLLSNMFVGGRVEGGEPFRMECARIDDLVDEPVDLVKIDVEGYEPRAVRGMERLISRSMPVLVSECNEYWLNTISDMTSSDYVDQLLSYGYDVYRLGDPLEPIARGALRLELLEVVDVLAVPHGRSPSDFGAR